MNFAKMLTCAALLSGMAAVLSGTAQADPFQSGQASWYGPGFHGRQTASGERFNSNDMTAAHKTLPFGTKIKVTNKQTGKSIVVRINDRGPYAKDRVIDLSEASAQAIGLSGIADVALVWL
jgi:rare lipoprotein A